jgi:glycerol-3-phosphate acyltransferase PlsY
VALGLRSVFEPVMVAYYLWPALAVALIAASRSWSRLIPASAAAVVLTLVSQLTWRGVWSWWTPMIAGLALTLFFARSPAGISRATAGPPQAPAGPAAPAAPQAAVEE